MNMTINEATAIVAAILTTLAEVNEPAPESTLYILCKMDMDKWSKIRTILINGGFVTIKSHLVTLTAKGKTVADSINAKLAAK